jgi:hypothetical protein
MASDGSPENGRLLGRRVAIGLGVASGLTFAGAASGDAFGKSPLWSAPDPQLKAASEFALKSNWKSGPGYWAVSYSGDHFAGVPQLLGDPQLLTQKPQAGTMPSGWGLESGSIVVGRSAVLRLVHQVHGREVHVTLLPGETMADMQLAGLGDGAWSWKLYPVANLQPPY